MKTTVRPQISIGVIPFTCITVLLRKIHFEIQIPATTQNPPDGYLFVCPTTHFFIGPTLFRRPYCPAYWSLDPTGAELLPEKVIHLGFPTIQFTTFCSGNTWDPSTYAGVRQFHEAKGFDPNSQDVALHLGWPLYRASGEAFVQCQDHSAFHSY